ncbi:MAG: transcription elongation factor GreA [Deltaproteobacteria bacterium]|nr:transcription elongation factor GreA [Deltaproteobacteria bacterium]
MILQPSIKKPLTRKGHQKLAEEYTRLVKITRPEVVQGIATAAAEGDRSENAEYIYGKKRLRELDKRIRYLNSVLKDAQIIDPQNLTGDRVCFGCTVRVRDEQGFEKEWMLVGDGESNSQEGKISWKSPVARALYGKKTGDVVLASRPAGEMEFEILAINFTEG